MGSARAVARACGPAWKRYRCLASACRPGTSVHSYATAPGWARFPELARHTGTAPRSTACRYMRVARAQACGDPLEWIQPFLRNAPHVGTTVELQPRSTACRYIRVAQVRAGGDPLEWIQPNHFSPQCAPCIGTTVELQSHCMSMYIYRLACTEGVRSRVLST